MIALKSSTNIGYLHLSSHSFEILHISNAMTYCSYLKYLFICVADYKGDLGEALLHLIWKDLLS